MFGRGAGVAACAGSALTPAKVKMHKARPTRRRMELGTVFGMVRRSILHYSVRHRADSSLNLHGLPLSGPLCHSEGLARDKFNRILLASLHERSKSVHMGKGPVRLSRRNFYENNFWAAAAAPAAGVAPCGGSPIRFQDQQRHDHHNQIHGLWYRSDHSQHDQRLTGHQHRKLCILLDHGPDRHDPR